ncbi:uncharacterized protein LOC134531046 isoform X1 [Bacillus rossius redtenbacheri]|uniref:uncharacterized protein LOC134531046 isoform X1 n=1 Tax=Bacillus rossius redtenbacheri TaxID=93214 RepID=UPI002FDE6C37
MGLLARSSPLVRGVAAYAVIWPVSSLCQQLIAGAERVDCAQAARFALYGSCFVAPSLQAWLSFAQRAWPGRSWRATLTKVRESPRACWLQLSPGRPVSGARSCHSAAGAGDVHALRHCELLLRHDAAGGPGLGRGRLRGARQVPAHLQGGGAGVAGRAGVQLQRRAGEEPRALRERVQPAVGVLPGPHEAGGGTAPGTPPRGVAALTAQARVSALSQHWPATRVSASTRAVHPDCTLVSDAPRAARHGPTPRMFPSDTPRRAPE